MGTPSWHMAYFLEVHYLHEIGFLKHVSCPFGGREVFDKGFVLPQINDLNEFL